MKLAETLRLEPLGGDLARVEAELGEAVRHQDRFLGDVASHLVGAGGKRVRPTLALGAAYAATDADGPATAEAVTGAVAVELVHLGSLYHDDVIDEAETRRGVPSVNARWSNIVAILSGDFLLARASSLAASLGADVAGLLADTIGELCRGQVLELQHLFDVDRSEEGYASAIEGKTASLFAASCRIGGMVTGADEPGLDALTRYGHHLGLCFQIVDDVLDITATDDALGKPAGQDLVEGVYTLPVLRTLALGRSAGDELASLLGQPLEMAERDKALAIVRANEGVESAAATARQYVMAAESACSDLPDGPATDALRAAAGTLLESAIIPA